MTRLTTNAVAGQPTTTLPAKPTKLEHICLCLDTSGSMACMWGVGDPDRMEREGVSGGSDSATRILLKQHAVTNACQAILDSSDPSKTAFSVVSFNTKARVECPQTTDFDEVALVLAFDSNGGTNMRDGIAAALQQSPDRIILLSDGQVSRYSVEAQVQNAKILGIVIDTISIPDADLPLMEYIAKETGGIHTECRDPLELIRTFLKLETTARLALTHNS